MGLSESVLLMSSAHMYAYSDTSADWGLNVLARIFVMRLCARLLGGEGPFDKRTCWLAAGAAKMCPEISQ